MWVAGYSNCGLWVHLGTAFFFFFFFFVKLGFFFNMGFYSSGILAGSGRWWRGGHGGGTMPEVEGRYISV